MGTSVEVTLTTQPTGFERTFRLERRGDEGASEHSNDAGGGSFKDLPFVGHEDHIVELAGLGVAQCRHVGRVGQRFRTNERPR